MRALQYSQFQQFYLTLFIADERSESVLCVPKQSIKISNDQELIQSDPTSCPQNQRETTKYINWLQFTKGTRGKPNEQLFPRQVVIHLPKIY